MNLRLLLIAGICLVALSLTVSQSYAQRGYQPAYPTFSPAFNYLRSDTGVLNRYYGLVQPRRQIESTRNRMRDASQQQQAAINSLQGEISQMRQALATPSGKSASFMNFSHFFPGLNLDAGRRR